MRRLLALVALATALLLPSPAAAAAPDSDPRAVRIAEQVLRELGGSERWNALTGLRWTFAVSMNDTVRSSRRHAWNMRTGEHRVEGIGRDGTPFVFVHTLGDTTSGAAWLGEHALSGDSLRTLIKRADALWTNDSYWFLMPYKMLDPGVHLSFDREVNDSTGTFDRIAMRFDHVGLTPGDRYWVDVNRRTRRVERWEYVLESRQPPAVRWTWEGWERHHDLWFPTAHVQERTTIFTREVEAVDTFPPNTFRER